MEGGWVWDRAIGPAVIGWVCTTNVEFVWEVLVSWGGGSVWEGIDW